MEFTLSNVIALVFGDQYRTMAVYYNDEDGTKKMSEAMILRVRSLENSSPVYHKMRLDPTSGKLTINEMTSGYPATTDPGWRDFDFESINTANDVWMDGGNIVIGTGDIRGGTPTIYAYDLSEYDVIITSTGKHWLRMHK